MTTHAKSTSDHHDRRYANIACLSAIAVIALAAPAVADIEQPTAPRSRASRVAPADLDAPITLKLPAPSLLPLAEILTDDSTHLRLPALAPDSLELRVRIDPLFVVYLSADLDNPGLARLDDIDGETYFALGLELHLTRRLCLFVEDYQAAGMVLGDEGLIDEPAPERTWDGHQISVGVRAQLTDSVAFEGAAVGYVQSLTGRSSGVGARVGVSVSF